MAPYPWYEDLDATASPPPTVSAVAVSSSQDDRGFTQGEESFTHLLLVFHAQRSDIRERSTPRLFSACPSHSFSRRAVNLHAGYSSRLDACVLGVSVIAVFLARCINNNTTNTFVTRAAILPTRTHPLALFATAPPVPKPQTMAFTAAFASSCILQAGHRHTSTLAQLFPAVASSVSRSPRGLCSVFLYIVAALPRLLVGSLTPRRAFTGAMIDSYAERYNDMISKFNLLFLFVLSS